MLLRSPKTMVAGYLALALVAAASSVAHGGYLFGVYSHPDSAFGDSPSFSELVVQPWTPTTAYICVAHTTDSLAVAAWEGELYGTALENPLFHVLSVDFFPQPTALNAGTDLAPLVGLGQCVKAPSRTTYVLAEIHFLIEEAFDVGSLMIIGREHRFEPRISRCDDSSTPMVERPTLLVRNSTLQKVSLHTLRPARDLIHPEFPSREFDVLVGVARVIDVEAPRFTAKGGIPFSILRMRMLLSLAGEPMDTTRVVSAGAIYRTARGVSWVPEVDQMVHYVKAGELLLFGASRLPDRLRHFRYEPYEGLRRIRFIDRILQDPALLDQETYRQASWQLVPADPDVLFRPDGSFDSQYIEQVLEPTGHTLRSRIEEIDQYYRIRR